MYFVVIVQRGINFLRPPSPQEIVTIPAATNPKPRPSLNPKPLPLNLKSFQTPNGKPLTSLPPNPMRFPQCKGVEYSLGRCELWTRHVTPLLLLLPMLSCEWNNEAMEKAESILLFRFRSGCRVAVGNDSIVPTARICFSIPNSSWISEVEGLSGEGFLGRISGVYSLQGWRGFCLNRFEV